MSEPRPPFSAALMEVLRKTRIESSSDFIVALYAVAKIYSHKTESIIEPIHYLEYNNCHVTSGMNLVYFEEKTSDFDLQDYQDMVVTYSAIVDFFLNSNPVSLVFKMDNNDHLGAKIWKELDSKLVYLRKMMYTRKYQESLYA